MLALKIDVKRMLHEWANATQITGAIVLYIGQTGK